MNQSAPLVFFALCLTGMACQPTGDPADLHDGSIDAHVRQDAGMHMLDATAGHDVISRPESGDDVADTGFVDVATMSDADDASRRSDASSATDTGADASDSSHAADVASEATFDAATDGSDGAVAITCMTLGLTADCLACPPGSTVDGCDTYGVPVSGRPSWAERAIFTLTDAFRMAPGAFEAAYTTPRVTDGSATNLTPAPPAAAPLLWDDLVSQAAHAHAADRASCAMPSPSYLACDGTPFATWFAPYMVTGGVDAMVNFALGLDPLEFVNGWICDGSVFPATGALVGCQTNANAADRTFLTDVTYSQAAAGYADGTATPFADVILVNGSQSYDSLIVAASHEIIAGVPKFFIDYSDPSRFPVPPAEVAVVLDGSLIPATLELGTATQGTYTWSAPAASMGCRSYYVLAITAAGQVWRYPAAGTFATYGEGGCTSDYAP